MRLTELLLLQRYEKNLQENTLYKDAAEKAALLASKDKIAEAFVYNFLGMLGLINATSDGQRALLKTHFMNDKKVRIDNIDDTNHDISLVVKLAKDAGFFKNDTVVNNITRFLAKLKAGQVDQVNSELVASWLDDMKPEFYSDIRDPQTKKHVLEFKADGGKAVDISRVAIRLKARVNKLDHGGEYKAFAKTFGYLKEKDLVTPAATTAVPSAGTISVPIAPSYTAPASQPTVNKRTRRTKAQMQAARAGSIIASVPVTAPPPVPIATPPVAKPPVVPDIPKLTNEVTPRLNNISDLLEYAFKYDEDVATQCLDRFEKDIRRSGYTDAAIDYMKKHFKEVRSKFKPILDLKVVFFKRNVDDIIEYIRYSNIFEDQATGTEKFLSTVEDEYNGFYRKILSASVFMTLYHYPDISRIEKVFRIFGTSHIYQQIQELDNSSLDNRGNIVKSFVTTFKIPSILGTSIYGQITDSTSMSSDIGRMFCLFAAKLHYENLSILDAYKEVKTDYYKKENIRYIIKLSEFAGHTYFAGTYPAQEMIEKCEEMVDDDLPHEFIDEIILPMYEDKPSIITKNSTVGRIMIKEYKQDLLGVGPEHSKIAKDVKYESSLLEFIKLIGESTEYFSRLFPNDQKLLGLRLKVVGVDSLTPNELISHMEYKAFSNYKKGYGANPNTTIEDFKALAHSGRLIASHFNGVFRSNPKSGNTIGKTLKVLFERDPPKYDTATVFAEIMKMLPEMDKEVVVDIIQVAKKNNYKSFFSPDIYKDTSRRAEKDAFKSLITGVMHDCIGTDVEDYFSEILEEMPGGVIDAIRKNLVGMNSLIAEVEKGEIQPFDAIGDNRLKQMLAMNDIDVASLVSEGASRRKRKEKWGDYFKRVKAELEKAGDKKFLGKEKVELVKGANVRKLSKTYNTSFHAGKHGDIYAKILKEFNASVKFPEFDEFRRNNPGDGTVVPAFHGTGGIAATMILRYGFKVIKSTDPSVVGRMLGDGIYLSNKLDKALQYVSNSGYGRHHGTKGYIFELDVNLGKKGSTNNSPDYRVKGLSGNDGIVSPEWCVSDPKKQVAIKKVYEVELVSRYNLDQYTLNESSGALLSFKNFIKESTQVNNNVAAFTFRDGMIPIVGKDDEMTFVDFEDAIKDKLIPEDMIDFSSQGPVVMFRGADKQEGFDIRFAETITNDAYVSYVKNFKRVFLAKKA